MFSLIIAFMLSSVVVQGSDYSMTVNTECAKVITDSGYTEALDIHRYVTGTPEYVEACF